MSDDCSDKLGGGEASADSPGLSHGFLSEAGVSNCVENDDIRTTINTMALPQRLRLAMLGNSVCRSLLITDGNRSVQLAVLDNPRLQVSEVEGFAKNKNVSDAVLRVISENKDWSKQYSVRVALVNNPKTPQDISIKWVNYLRTSDKKILAKSKNVPQVVAIAARRALVEKVR